MTLDIPLMFNNIIGTDIDVLCDFLKNSDRFTNGPKVREFEKTWSEWLGVKYSVFVNSGASANLITLSALKIKYGDLPVCLPPLTWSSDVASVFHCGMKPEFIDINLNTLAMDEDTLVESLSKGRKFVFLTHILGLNGLTDKILKAIEKSDSILIEDVCESHGATFNGKKLGSIGHVSNFSYYYAHHMSTIEGGMLCTNDEELYEIFRMLRSHGMTREVDSDELKDEFIKKYPNVHKEFTFMHPGYNMRSTELNAVLGLSQIKRLDDNNKIRCENFELFISKLDNKKYFTDYNLEGNVSYALLLLLRNDDDTLFKNVCTVLNKDNVEYRRGMSGGGNMLRQPFVQARIGDISTNYPNTERVHKYGMYIGNFPELEKEKILKLCEILNEA